VNRDIELTHPAGQVYSIPEPLQGGLDGCKMTPFCDSLLLLLYRLVQLNNNEPVL
jgi:hypothetical protein